ncbi:putative gustatory receptor 28b [Temnothorax longispinosus]|uniref:putative gustatory receptor 28b n=1 Tax=Temnothorax longispinosus TaxID=300112 RepID=UPI003A98F375
MFYYEQRSPFLIINLKALKKQHLVISDAVKMLNIIFSLQLLATIVLTFSEITFGLYLHIIQYNRENGLFIKLDIKIGLVFLNMIHHTVKMTLLVWACETGKNQAQEIRTTIHDVLNISRDEQIKNELQLFSLQTLHCKNTFSAKGLNVDATFLATMTGTIATYMLILLQFLIISHSCDEKSAINST